MNSWFYGINRFDNYSKQMDDQAMNVKSSKSFFQHLQETHTAATNAMKNKKKRQDKTQDK